MATAKVMTARLADEDVAILNEVQTQMGLFSTSDALRFVIRHYAKTQGIELPKPKAKKRKR